MEFGEQIRVWRVEKDMPIRKLAALLDIDTSTLSKIERNERPVSLSMIPIVASVFNKDFEKLQVMYLSSKLVKDYGDIEHADEAMKEAMNELKKKK